MIRNEEGTKAQMQKAQSLKDKKQLSVNSVQSVADNHETKREVLIDEPPPVFSSWNRLYSVVLLNLFVLIVLFYVITRIFE